MEQSIAFLFPILLASTRHNHYIRLCSSAMSAPSVNLLDEDTEESCKLSDAPTGEYWRWCPRCTHELHERKCKLICPRCHYFMSCSDFD